MNRPFTSEISLQGRRRPRLRRWVVVVAAAVLAPFCLFAEEEDDDPGIEEIITTPPERLKQAEPPESAPSSPSPVAPRKANRPAPATARAHPKAMPATPAPTPEAADAPKIVEEASEPDHGPASAPLPSSAGPEGNSGAPPNARPPTSTGRPLPFRSVIHSVDPSAPLFTMGKKKIRVVHVTTATRFTRVDGEPATFEMLEPGLEVRGSARKLAQSEWEAVSVKIGSKAAAETGTLDD